MSTRVLGTIAAALLTIGSAAMVVRAQSTASVPAPDPVRYTAQGELMRPDDYREWIYLSSGLGMTYSPTPAAASAAPPASAAPRTPSFTNVFVNPASYRHFVQTGTWPDKTMFVLEVRASATEGSINVGGNYQTDLQAIEVEVKDARLPDGWAYFNFGRAATPVKALPVSAPCYTCHGTNAAVEHTFVQFYPSLMDVATAKGTINRGWTPHP
ncbi:MAG: cytochrome P460 family protein [Acidobacteriaceae bacterium]|jgi:hypothetical protein|nr:cytochrome P460 family protein [Acidobacteriaceae bacterium]